MKKRNNRMEFANDRGQRATAIKSNNTKAIQVYASEAFYCSERFFDAKVYFNLFPHSKEQ